MNQEGIVDIQFGGRIYVLSAIHLRRGVGSEVG